MFARVCACDHRRVGRTVLIVDDHAGFRGLARRLLEADGYTVIGEADGARAALASAEALRPDLVLLDVMLPDGDGFTVAERLAGTGIAVVLTSSRDADDYGQRLAASPARGFIHKDRLSGATLAEVVGGPP
jgi:DNA-binding NarL/FixJ family response regulator